MASCPEDDPPSAPTNRLRRRRMRRLALAHGRSTVALFTALFAIGLVSFSPVVHGQRVDLVDRAALRVCADPANMPFSSDKGEGFENKVADIVAAELKLPVEYTW